MFIATWICVVSIPFNTYSLIPKCEYWKDLFITKFWEIHVFIKMQYFVFYFQGFQLNVKYIYHVAEKQKVLKSVTFLTQKSGGLNFCKYLSLIASTQFFCENKYCETIFFFWFIFARKNSSKRAKLYLVK